MGNRVLQPSRLVTGNLSEHFMTVLMLKMLFLTASLNTFHCNSCPLSLVLPPRTLAKSLAPFLENLLAGTVRLLFVPYKAISSPGQTNLVPSALLVTYPPAQIPRAPATSFFVPQCRQESRQLCWSEDTVGCQPAAVVTDVAFSSSA